MHHIRVEPPFEPKRQWEWDGNIVTPTVKPSVHIRCEWPPEDGGLEVCHYFIEAGRLRFLDDCTHAMKGITMDMPPLPEHYRDNLLP